MDVFGRILRTLILLSLFQISCTKHESGSHHEAASHDKAGAHHSANHKPTDEERALEAQLTGRHEERGGESSGEVTAEAGHHQAAHHNEQGEKKYDPHSGLDDCGLRKAEAPPAAHEVADSGVDYESAISKLRTGNSRYTTGFLRKDGQSQSDRDRLVPGEKPHTIVLSCSDSRVPPEVVFDQKLGEVFVVRTAGEALDSSAIASIEYALDHLGSHLLVVMAHESCGAVKAAFGTLKGQDAGSPSLNKLVHDIHPRIRQFIDLEPSKGFVSEAKANASGVARDLVARSEIVASKVKADLLHIETAIYHLDSGAVEFYNESMGRGLASVEAPIEAPKVVAKLPKKSHAARAAKKRAVEKEVEHPVAPAAEPAAAVSAAPMAEPSAAPPAEPTVEAPADHAVEHSVEHPVEHAAQAPVEPAAAPPAEAQARLPAEHQAEHHPEPSAEHH